MRKLSLIFVLVWFIGSFFWSHQPVSAQDCENLYVDDSQSQADLDVAVLCEAASGWTEQGFQVYVFLTDYVPSSEQAWWDTLDAFEASLNLGTSDTLHETAIVFEASTMAQNRYAANVTISEVILGNTPLWQDENLIRIKSQFRTLLATGDYTNAFSQIMQLSLETAFPPPTATPIPSNTPLPTATTDPAIITQQAVIAQGTATQQAIVAEIQQAEDAAERQELMNTLKNLGIAVVVLVILGAGGYFGALPAYFAWLRDRAYRQQIQLVQTRSAKLLNLSQELLQDSDPLYGLWEAYGGALYPDQDALVKSLLVSARQAFESSSRTFNEAKSSTISLEERVHAWEMLYLTIVGTTDEVLLMNEAEQEALLNPLIGLSPEIVGDELYQQIEQVFENLKGDKTLQIDLKKVDPQTVQAAGILGSVRQVKQELFQLQEAHANAGPDFEEASALLQDLEYEYEIDPDILSLDDALAYAREQLNAAETALEAERWLEVSSLVAQAMAYLDEAPDIWEEYEKSVESAMIDYNAIQTLEENGFKNLEPANVLAQLNQNSATFKQALLVGDLEKATEYADEVVADADDAIRTAQARQELHAQNQQRLEELSERVAFLQSFAQDEVETAWTQLQAYPSSNWGDTASQREQALAIISESFDDPTNADDLSSQIERLNALSGDQKFDQAAVALDAAFARLGEAEQFLNAVVAQLVLVLEAQASVQEALTAARGDIQAATQVRDADATKVDETVDQQLKQAGDLADQAEQVIAQREFTQAADLIKQARTLAIQAQTSANEQVIAINNALSDLDQVQKQVTSNISQLNEDFSQLPQAAHTSILSQAVNNAHSVLAQARNDDQRVSGLEDERWLEALESVTNRYREVLQEVNEATAQVESAKTAYDNLYNQAKAEVEEADSIITQARRYVSDSDAGSAGENALRRAQSNLPSMVAYGAGYDALRQIHQQARMAIESAEEARQQAQSRIRAVEAQREQERLEQQRQLEAQRARDRQVATVLINAGSTQPMGNNSRRTTGMSTPRQSTNRTPSVSRPSSFSTKNRTSTGSSFSKKKR